MSPEEFVGFILGGLKPRRLNLVWDHLDTCPDCVHILAVLGRLGRYLKVY